MESRRSSIAKLPPRGPSADEIKRRPSRTDNLEKEGKNGRRSWTTSAGWKSYEAYIYNDVKNMGLVGTLPDSCDDTQKRIKLRSISLRGTEKRNGLDGGQRPTQYRKLLKLPLAMWPIVRKTKEKNCKTNTREFENT